MEKRKTTYDLDSIKAEFSSVDKLRMTRTARNDAFALGFALQDVVEVIQAMTRRQFYKSMTSIADARVWQDVYHVPAGGIILYVKFTMDHQGKLLISFKEK
jgi:motility quorum-sensing regulator / GCU-specific mRNA interferase toxin